jgi:2-iminobutanoate/2-iminopropanoate deaminase
MTRRRPPQVAARHDDVAATTAPLRRMEAGMTTSLPFRPGVPAGGWLAVSGQVGLKDGVLAEGARAQTAQALANLREVVESHGAGLADVVKTNVFLVSMDDYAGMNEEYAAVFRDQPPARSAVAVHQLPLGALVEIEAWVHLPAD